MIRITNVRTRRDDKLSHEREVRVHRPYLLGNPIVMKSESDRQEVIDKFRALLTREMTRPESPMRQEIMRLRRHHNNGANLELICFCAPKACHAEVIKEFIEAEDEKLNLSDWGTK